jgi:two-component system chemotaxis response regulator CheB
MSGILATHPATASDRLRVLVCDDSLVIRNSVTRMLRAEADFEVVAGVRNGQAAVDTVRTRTGASSIDVVVLDIEMPVMDGMSALPLLLEIDPSVRVIMASTLTLRGASVTIEALALGAADYIPKPSTTGTFNDDEFRADLVAKVRGLGRLRRREQLRRPTLVAPQATIGYSRRPGGRTALLAIGSSTGGPQALFTFFRSLGPKLGIPVILTQHMPASFVPLLADQIARIGGLTCSVAERGELLRPDHVVIAPGGMHLTINATPSGLAAGLSDAPPENYCRPSVDVMLRSVADACGARAIVLMLTGMGRDGLAGTRAVVSAGGVALAQDEDTSVVWGMPGAIAKEGLCHSVLPLARLANAVRELATP